MEFRDHWSIAVILVLKHYILTYTKVWGLSRSLAENQKSVNELSGFWQRQYFGCVAMHKNAQDLMHKNVVNRFDLPWLRSTVCRSGARCNCLRPLHDPVIRITLQYSKREYFYLRT